jgi:hypothetical protein
MGNEYYDNDGYVYTKTGGSFEPKWDVLSQSQAREGADLNYSPSGYSSDGKPLYSRRESASSDGSSGDDGLSLAIAIIIFIMLVIIVIAAALILYVIVAPAVGAVHKEIKTKEGKQQIRNFAITMAVSMSLIILSVATSRALLGFYSNDWIRLIQFILTTTLWGVTLHYAIKREYWRPALDSCQFFGHSYVEESKRTFQGLQQLVRRYA